MINKLVIANLKYRPVRTVLSIIAISIQVTMVLTLVGLSTGLLEDQKIRNRGIGADLVVRSPGSSLLSISTNMEAGILGFVRKQPHVAIATGTLIVPTGGLLGSVTGIDLLEFSRLGGGFRFVAGGPFTGPNQIIIDTYYAKEHKERLGADLVALNRTWKVVGIVQPGILARELVPLGELQDLTSNVGKLTVIYVKLDNPALTNQVVAALRSKLPDYPIYSMEEFTTLFSPENVPALKPFMGVIIGLGVLVGFLVVFLSMYTAVLERTRDIGILKALGASPLFIISTLLRETVFIAVLGSILGVLLTYGTRWVIEDLVPGSLRQAIVPDWWPIAGGIAVGGALLGALYPGLMAARQDPIEALSYE